MVLGRPVAARVTQGGQRQRGIGHLIGAGAALAQHLQAALRGRSRVVSDSVAQVVATGPVPACLPGTKPSRRRAGAAGGGLGVQQLAGRAAAGSRRSHSRCRQSHRCWSAQSSCRPGHCSADEAHTHTGGEAVRNHRSRAGRGSALGVAGMHQPCCVVHAPTLLGGTRPCSLRSPLPPQFLLPQLTGPPCLRPQSSSCSPRRALGPRSCRRAVWAAAQLMALQPPSVVHRARRGRGGRGALAGWHKHSGQMLPMVWAQWSHSPPHAPCRAGPPLLLLGGVHVALDAHHQLGALHHGVCRAYRHRTGAGLVSISAGMQPGRGRPGQQAGRVEQPLSAHKGGGQQAGMGVLSGPSPRTREGAAGWHGHAERPLSAHKGGGQQAGMGVLSSPSPRTISGMLAS